MGQELTVPKYFYRQPSSRAWYVRVVPPTHTRHAVTEREFRRSTGHDDLRLAYPVGMTLIAQKLREWNALARSVVPHHATLAILTEELIRGICSARLYSWMKGDDEDRDEGLTDEEVQVIEDFCRLTDTAMRAVLSQGRGSSHWPGFVDSVLHWAEDLGYELDPADASFPDLVRQFAQVERTASEGISIRNKGGDAQTPPEPVDAFRTLSSIIEHFSAYKAAKSGGKHVGTIVNAWRLFIEYVGDIRFDAVTPGHVFNFMVERMRADNKPWSERRARGFGKRALREVFGLARTQGWMTIPNPVDGLEAFPSLSKEEEASRMQPRYPFDTDQLNALFASAWYDPHEKRRFTGKMRIDLGARYWVPLIGLFHGNRVHEGVQIVASDFWMDGDALVLSFRTEIDNDEPKSAPGRMRPKRASLSAPASDADKTVASLRSLKNPATRRVVPVHPALVELGLAEFIESRRREGGDQALLFPSSLPEAGGKSPKLGRAYEQAFLRFVRDVLAFGHGFGNHSFRHQLEDRVRDAQVTTGLWPAGLGQQYTGRTRTRAADREVLLQEGSEARYGNGYAPSAMLAFVQRLDFIDIKLPEPYARWLPRADSPNEYPEAPESFGPGLADVNDKR